MKRLKKWPTSACGEKKMKLHDFGLSVHFLPVNLAKGWKK